MHSKHNICPVCGYPHLDIPAYDEFNCSSYEICPSCGTQFGYDDAGYSHETLRSNWLKKECPWYGHQKPPKNWDPMQQLKMLVTNIKGK